MWLADQWKDYEVLDTSNGEKLERWGDYFLVRPDPTGSMGHPKEVKTVEEAKWTLSQKSQRRRTVGIL